MSRAQCRFPARDGGRYERKCGTDARYPVLIGGLILLCTPAPQRRWGCCPYTPLPPILAERQGHGHCRGWGKGGGRIR